MAGSDQGGFVPGPEPLELPLQTCLAAHGVLLCCFF